MVCDKIHIKNIDLHQIENLFLCKNNISFIYKAVIDGIILALNRALTKNVQRYKHLQMVLFDYMYIFIYVSSMLDIAFLVLKHGTSCEMSLIVFIVIL